MADYRVETLDLTLASDRKEIVSRNTKVANVAILEFTIGTNFEIHLGSRAGIPVTAALLDFRACPEENDGVFITHTAQPGVTVKVLIGFGDDGGGLAVGS